MLYHGRIAAVTGGTSGVGEAIARALAAAGAAGLTIAGRDGGRGERIAAELTAQGCPTLFLPGDLADADTARAVVLRTVECYGRIDGLANCAASTERSTLDTTTPELFDRIMAVNVRAPLLSMQEAIRDMRGRGEPGAILNIISTEASGGAPYLTAYATSKGALATLTRNVAAAHRFDRIRVNGILLGWTETPHEDAVQRRYHGAGDDWLAAAAAKAPMGRLAQPDEIADLAVLLLSDRGGIMTGSLIEYSQD
ncbi:SDR family oxidoreductase [Dactylosporangium vinaceum]|uniref:SDR family oxidoreductase n=1 Tax=Dactylosporangium vinaceum TaxID=53362 RepID=A0ABV5M5V1_9ACTN|nr:SDR family oxidoreductase [Dactylosporangium vinaceum]